MADYKEYDQYLEKTKNQAHSLWLPDAVTEIKSGAKNALDLGCGAGRDTKYLLEQGFEVAAIDHNPKSAEYLKKLPHQERLNFVLAEFKDFEFPAGAYDLINSQFSLPYAERGYFTDVFTKLEKSLKTGGVFVGQLFGVKDDWSKSPTSRTKFHTKEEAEALFKNWEVIRFGEYEEDKALDNGTMKHWHTFHIIARKK